jgi:hypothetical protein
LSVITTSQVWCSWHYEQSITQKLVIPGVSVHSELLLGIMPLCQWPSYLHCENSLPGL